MKAIDIPDVERERILIRMRELRDQIVLFLMTSYQLSRMEALNLEWELAMMVDDDFDDEDDLFYQEPF